MAPRCCARRHITSWLHGRETGHGSSTSRRNIERISIADFEADCLRLLDQIVRQRRSIIITKHDKPLAKMMPMEEGIDIFGRMAGTATICGDLISPIEDAGWTGDGPTSDAKGGSNPRPEACRGHLHH